MSRISVTDGTTRTGHYKNFADGKSAGPDGPNASTITLLGRLMV